MKKHQKTIKIYAFQTRPQSSSFFVSHVQNYLTTFKLLTEQAFENCLANER